MRSIRDWFLANWKNKVVALFFAVIIWFVAFQSENRTLITTLQVSLAPLQPDKTVVMSALVENRAGGEDPFDGKVRILFSGPRKEIEQLKLRLDQESRERTVRVEPGRERHEFSPVDFDFTSERIDISSIEPPLVRLQQEEVVEKTILDLEEKITVEPFLPGYDVVKEIIKPKSRTIRLRVPKSLEDDISVRVTVNMPYDREEVEGLFDLRILSSDEALARRTVRILDFDQQPPLWVSPDEAPHVHLRVRLTANQDFLERDAVKVTFRLPLMSHAYQVELPDAPGGTIPLKFIGPKDQIDKLRKTFEEDPGFAICVPPPTGFEADKTNMYTFTEEDLELPGFPRVRIQQHDSRKRELKTAWLFRVRVVTSLEGKES
ncbi:MAG: hypothetical protein JXA90_14180 [Planctomycetes bacterium]|nr:hypothetical protein [Planctomycetota bacterium]